MAQNASYRFLKITSSDGLSQNSINDIHQDAFGYLWFATQDGLNKYDGYQFTVYRPDRDDVWSISDNFIRYIHQGENDNLWLLARYGLNYFNRSTGKFHKFIIRENDYINVANSVFKWKGQTVAMFEGQAYILPSSPTEPTTLLKETIPLPSDSIRYACNCGKYTLFSVPKGFLSYNNSTGDTVLFLGRATYGADQKIEVFGQTAYFPYQNKVNSFDCSSGVFKRISSHDAGGDIQAIWKQQNGDIWVAHVAGIDIVKPNLEMIELRHDPKDDWSLSYPLVHSFLKDDAGTMWVGTANGGLNYIPAGSQRFIHYSEASGLFNHQVWSVFQDDQDRILVGTETGLNIIENGRVTAEYAVLIKQFSEKRITALTKDKYGQYWIGTSVEGLYRTKDLHTPADKITLDHGNQYHQSVSCLEEVGESMWVGTLGNLHRVALRGELEQSYTYSTGDKSMAYILSLKSVGKSMYIGAALGLFVYSFESDTVRSYLFQPGSGDKVPSFQFITGIEPDDHGKIWLSTFGGGLNAFNPEKESFEFYGVQHGLSNGILAGMKRFGNELWMAHNQGVSCFNISTKKFKNFGIRDGLPFAEFSLGGGYKSTNGDFLFGGTDGLVILNPKDLQSQTFEAQPILSEILINYHQSKSMSELCTERVSFIELQPEDDVVSFRFLTPDFINGLEYRYEYIMEGFDKSWVEASAIERRATYSNLPAGDYTFKVRVTDQNGNLSANQLHVPISVIPPFWQRTWFMLIASFSLLLIVSSVVRYFSQLRIKKQLRELELQHRVHRERERISMDLHDHVGAQITYLISNLDRLGMEERERDTNIKGLGKYAREAMRELRDTVWAIRKDAMPVSEMMQRISKYAHGLFQESKTEIELKFNAVSTLELDPAAALHLMRILQEAIQNIQKHANANHVFITVVEAKSEIIIEIKDDGVGFDEANIEGDDHNGIRNMRDRSSQIGAIFSIFSSKNQGAIIRIIVPLRSRI